MHTLRIFQTKSNYLLFGVNLVRLQESANVCSTFKLAFSKPQQEYVRKYHSAERNNLRDPRERSSWGAKDGTKFMERRTPRQSYTMENSNLGETLQQIDWKNRQLVPVKKMLYNPLPEALNRTEEEIEKFREENKISIIRGKSIVPGPVFSFQEAGFDDRILTSLENTDFSNPMPIQSQGWPIALSGYDLVSIGQTGSGKTLGFILPCIAHIKAQPVRRKGEGPIALVVAPTRELAQQIQEVADKFGRLCGVRSTCLFGGVSKNPQIMDIRRGVDLVIATPGRLIDILETGVTDLERCSYVVLDEADRCLDMGFEPQLRKIVDQIRPDRQMLMWSATWPKEVRSLARDFFTTEVNDGQEYVHLNIGSTDLQANHSITQRIEVVKNDEKVNRLLDILNGIKIEAEESEDNETPRILIFAATKKTVDFLERMIDREHHRVNGIHGDKSQLQRDRAMQKFRSGSCSILVATDVASRGLDVDDIKYVINFDFPNGVEDYIHRIGRTGRRGRSGTSITFITEANSKQVPELVKVLENAKQDVPNELLQLEHGNQKFGSSTNYSSSLTRTRGNYSRAFIPRSRRIGYRYSDALDHD